MFLFIIKFKRHKRNGTSKVDLIAQTDQKYLEEGVTLQGLKPGIVNSLENEIFFRLCNNTNSDGYFVLKIQPVFWSPLKT